MALIERATPGNPDGTVDACDRRCSNDGRRSARGRLWVRTLLAAGLALGAIGHARPGLADPRVGGRAAKLTSQTLVKERLGGLVIPFVANQGQAPERVKFYASSFAGTVSVVDGGDVVLALRKSDPRGPGKVTTLVESWVGGRRTEIRGEGRAPTVVNVFKGNDPARWQTNVPTYDRVSLGEVYDGIELKLQSRGRTVEKLFYVRPGAEPASIRVRVAGASRLAAAETGELEVETGMGEVRFSAPVAYQESSGTRQPVEVAYVVRGDEYGFRLGSYDRGRELVIDPILNSTFVGGASADSALAIAVDILGGVYVGGGTASPDFPGMGPDSIDPTFGTGTQGFFVQLDTNLNVILTATFLSGSGSVNESEESPSPVLVALLLLASPTRLDFRGSTRTHPTRSRQGWRGLW